MSFVFYDTETTGLDAAFNQILQFAAIRTDENLDEIDRFEIRCRLLPHVVPAPEALKVNGITVAQLTDMSLPSHYEMVVAIRARLMSWAPCNFVGYNSIGFDEHFIRHALYQTLHPPYLTNSAGSTRADILRIVRAAALFVPGALVIPTDESGEQSFNLDTVASANGFAHANAHEAMADVEATLFLSRLLVEEAPDVWSAAMRFSKRAAVTDYVENEAVFSLSDFYFGSPFSWLVTLIGTNSDNRAEHYVYNLAVDPATLVDLDSTELAVRLQELPKPVRVLRSNAAPVLMPASDAPDIAAGRELGLDELERRAEVVKSTPGLSARVIAAFQQTRELRAPSPYVEEQIYDGFSSDEDVRVMAEFHRVPWERRAGVLAKLKDIRLKQLGRQLIHIERPEALDEATRRDFDVTRATRLLEETESIPWLALPKAITDVRELLSSVTTPASRHLQEYHDYLLVRLARARTTIDFGNPPITGR